jgi:hypothetical protein
MIHPPIAHGPDHRVVPSSPFAIVPSSSLPISEVSVVTTEIEPIPVVLENTSNPHSSHARSQDAPPPEATPSTSPADEPSTMEKDQPDHVLDIVTQVPEQVMKPDITRETTNITAPTVDDEALAEHVDPNVSTSMTLDVDVDVQADKTESKTRTTNVGHISPHNVVLPDAASMNEGSSDAKTDVAKEKRKKHLEDDLHDGPPRKRARVKGAEKIRTTSKQEGKRRLESEDPDVVGSIPQAKKRRKSDRDAISGKRPSPSHSRSDASASASKSSSSSHEPSSSKPKQLDTDTPELDAEITGMLIECMATSRASSLPVSSLYKSVMECRPSLKAQHDEKEWVAVFRRVLKNGVAGSGVFGKVESSGKVRSFPLLQAYLRMVVLVVY